MIVLSCLLSPDENAKLKSALADLTKKHAAEIEDLTKDRDHHQKKVKDAQEFGQAKERDFLAARDELRTLQGRAKAWLNEFTKIYSTMSRKLPSFLFLSFFFLFLSFFFLFLSFFSPFSLFLFSFFSLSFFFLK